MVFLFHPIFMKKEKKKRVVDVKIHAFSDKGNGLAYYDHPAGMQWTLEVPFTRPGDFARVLLLKKRNAVYQCLLEEILQPSEQRIAPKCIHFASCGGCRWQHTSYQEQLKIKEDFVKKCFASLATPAMVFHPICPSNDPWKYRNKMEFSFSSNSAGDKFLGLMMDSSRGKVLNLTECHLVDRWFIDALEAVRQWWINSDILAYHPNKNTGALRTLILREGVRTGEHMAMLTVSGNPDYALHQPQLKSLVAALNAAVKPGEGGEKLSIFLRIQQIRKGHPTEFYEMHLGGPDSIQEKLHITRAPCSLPEELTFTISPSAFFQPNTQQAEKLYSLVLQLAKIPPDAVVYDLYCGTGTLGICIAGQVKEVIGVELSPEATLDAKTNLSLNRIGNMRVISGAVGEVLSRIYNDKDIPSPDAIIVDPPRAGLDPKSIQLLLALKPSSIIYVSCNPVTQASNIHELIQGGYALECLQPVDQFPQTVHIENIAILRRM